MIQDTTPITQLHEEVFEYLMEKRKTMPDLYFSMNTNPVDLEKGFIFEGGTAIIEFTFWQPLNICHFSINKNTQELVLSFNNIAVVIASKLEEQLNSSIKFRYEGDFPVYTKNYKEWTKGLNFFFMSDFDIITECLKRDIKLLPKSSFDYQIAQAKIYLPYLNTQYNPIKNQTGKSYYVPNPLLCLQNLTLNNIGHFENISLDLSKQVTVLIGENGSGKSTVLRAIALGITGTDFFDLDKDLQREKSEIFNGFLKIYEYQKAIPKYAQEGSIVLSINDKELTLQLSPSKLIATKVEIEEIKTNREIILHEGKYIKTLVLGFSQSEAKIVSKDFYVKGETKPSVIDLFPLISNAGKDGMNDLVEWIYYYVHDSENTEPIDKLFVIFSKIVADNNDNEAVTLKKPYKTEGVIGSPSGKKDIIVCTPDMPDGINLSLVSQGYKNIFRWVSGILMKVYDYQQNFFPEKNLAEISGIVLIDEIDTYLHPKWQRNILKVLVEEFPKLQFVVTTHSDEVLRNWEVTDTFNFSEISIYLIKDALAFIPSTNPIGRDANSVKKEVMGLNASKNELAIQQIANQIVEALTKKDFDLLENKKQELLQYTTLDHPIWIRINTLLNKIAI